MKAKLEKGQLSFSVVELFEHMSKEEQLELVDTLSCEDDIIRNVTAQLLDGWTERGSHGAKGCEPNNPHTPIDIARREIALRAGEVARDEIKTLVYSLKLATAREKAYYDWAWRLYHSRGLNWLAESCPNVSIDDGIYEVVLKSDTNDRYNCPIHGLQDGSDCPRC